MHFRFFGDSWFWTWNYSEPIGYNGFNSKAMKQLYETNDVGKQDCISIQKIMLEHMGHTVETHCHPGSSFNDTVNQITSTGPIPNVVNVVFYSQDMRSVELAKFLAKNKKDEYRVIENKLNFVTEKNLNRLAKFAHKTNQKFYLAGGQGTLLKHVFNTIEEEYKSNMVLVAECILSSVMSDVDVMGKFKLTDIIGEGNNVPPEAEVDWDQMQPDVIDNVYNQLNEWDKYNSFTQPDKAHMNATSTIFFLDLLFQAIESLDK